jgi:pyrroline-5-carboxylate reductase
VAGAKLATLSDGLNYSYIIRAMPNMPVQIGEGMTVWTTTAEVTQEHKKMARTILGTLGKEIYFPDEKYIDMATALSGSGPAYVFLFIEVLTDAGVHVGLSYNVAKELAIQTILGSACMARKVGKHPAELRNMVTSPGGTTAEALAQLERGGFRSSILEAVVAAYEKAKQL